MSDPDTVEQWTAIRQRLEDGVATARTEAAWYAFIALDDVREALDAAAALERAETRIAELTRNAEDGWFQLAEKERRAISVLLAAAENYDARLPREQGGEAQHSLVDKLRKLSTEGDENS